MKTFEFSSKETSTALFNPQNYLDSACDNVDFHANVDEMPQQDYQPGFSDDDDDGEMMHQQYDVEEYAGQAARRESIAAINDILGEMRSVVISDDEGDGEIGEEDASGLQTGMENFSFFDASANKNWIGPEYWRPSRSLGNILDCLTHDSYQEGS
jgi:hypothetical protein